MASAARARDRRRHGHGRALSGVYFGAASNFARFRNTMGSQQHANAFGAHASGVATRRRKCQSCAGRRRSTAEYLRRYPEHTAPTRRQWIRAPRRTLFSTGDDRRRRTARAKASSLRWARPEAPDHGKRTANSARSVPMVAWMLNTSLGDGLGAHASRTEGSTASAAPLWAVHWSTRRWRPQVKLDEQLAQLVAMLEDSAHRGDVDEAGASPATSSTAGDGADIVACAPDFKKASICSGYAGAGRHAPQR